MRRDLLLKFFKDVLVVSSHIVKEEGLELGDFVGLDLVEVTSDTGIDDADLFFSVEWLLDQ